MGVSLGSRAEGRTATRVRLTRAGVAVVAAFALLFVYYAWTATSSGSSFSEPTASGLDVRGLDYYNLQADAFLHGRLWLDVPFDPRLLTAKDPYALDIPTTVQGLADGSFYKDRYYLAWGPAPALTTFLPPRLLGSSVRESLVVTLYCCFGALFAAMTLTLLVRRLVPGTSRAVIWTGNATMALATSIPWMLRRPTVYEVAITAAFFFMMAGLLVLVRELLREESPRRGRLIAAGTLFGLAVLSRPTMVIVVGGVVALAWVLRPESRRATVPLILGIPVLAGAVFMIYNMARFSGPLDFGNKWQTSGKDLRRFPFNEISNLPPALYAYLVAPLHPTVGFPYIHLPPPPDAPLAANSDYRGEPTGSVVWVAPFVLLALVFATRRRHVAADDGKAMVKPVVLILLTISMLVLLAGAFSIPGYTERYKLDFLPWIVMAATLSWAALVQHASTPRRAAWWRRGGIVLGVWGALVGIAVSFTGYYDTFHIYNHVRYKSLERAFSPLPTLATMIAGRPMISGILAPQAIDHYSVGNSTKLDVSGVDVPLQPEQWAEFTIISPSARTSRLTFRTSTTAADTFAVSQSGAGETSVLVHDGSAGTLPVHLRRGVNYLVVGLTAGAGVTVDPTGAPPTVRLRDFDLR